MSLIFVLFSFTSFVLFSKIRQSLFEYKLKKLINFSFIPKKFQVNASNRHQKSDN